MPEVPAFLPPGSLTAHQPPALLIERVLRLEEDGGTVAMLPRDDVDTLVLMEACAQAIAVCIGAHAHAAHGAGTASGMLVGGKAFRLHVHPVPGEALTIRCRLLHALGPMQLHGVEAHAPSRGLLVADGSLKVVATGATP